MKPSERIKEIHKQIFGIPPCEPLNDYLSCLVQYLDQEWEVKKGTAKNIVHVCSVFESSKLYDKNGELPKCVQCGSVKRELRISKIN